jgi:PAS domain-containing protein
MDNSLAGALSDSGLRDLEQRLRDCEERFRTIADRLPLMIWVHDAKGEQEFVNQTFCEYFGVRREEMRSSPVKNILTVVQAIARYTASASEENFQQRFAERISSLAASHDLLVRSDWEGVIWQT